MLLKSDIVCRSYDIQGVTFLLDTVYYYYYYYHYHYYY